MNMQKKYKTLQKTWYIIPGFTLIPLLYVISGYSWRTIVPMVVFYFVMSIFIYRYHNRVVAEIKDGALYVHSGVGVSDPSSIKLDSIKEIERVTQRILKIQYGSNKSFSIEAEKNVLDQLEADLKRH